MKLWKPDDQRLKVHICGWRSVVLEAWPVDLYCITFLMLPRRSSLRSLRPSRRILKEIMSWDLWLDN